MIEDFVTFFGDCGRLMAKVLFIPTGVVLPFFVELFKDGESIGLEGPFYEDDAEELALNFINGENDDTHF